MLEAAPRRGKARRHQPPLTACPEYVQHRNQQFATTPFHGSSNASMNWNQRLQALPFFIAQIAGISVALHLCLSTSPTLAFYLLLPHFLYTAYSGSQVE